MYRRLGTAVLVAAIAAACGGVIDPSKNQIETFTGTIPKGKGVVVPTNGRSINITKSGEISVTVTSLTPSVPSGTYFQVILGQVLSGQCSTGLSSNSFAIVGTAAINGPITPGTYCIALVDEGLFTVDEAFSVTVSHP
jgi:hypothetical protein